MPPLTCIATGDPHYKTYDGLMFDWMGRCGYVMMRDCAANHTGETAQHHFEVQVKNDPFNPVTRTESSQVTWTAGVAIRALNGDIIELFQEGTRPNIVGLLRSYESQVTTDLFLNTSELVVDGTNGYTLTMPTTVQPGSRGIITLRVDTLGIIVRWNGRTTVGIELDRTSPLISEGGLCGLCGNANGDASDDSQMVSRHDHWLVGGTGSEDPAEVNLFNPDGPVSSCNESPSAGQPCVCDDPAAPAFCGVLVNETGPFGVCQELLPHHQSFYDACVCDYCHDRAASTEVINAFEADCYASGRAVAPYIAATSPPTRSPTTSAPVVPVPTAAPSFDPTSAPFATASPSFVPTTSPMASTAVPVTNSPTSTAALTRQPTSLPTASRSAFPATQAPAAHPSTERSSSPMVSTTVPLTRSPTITAAATRPPPSLLTASPSVSPITQAPEDTAGSTLSPSTVPIANNRGKEHPNDDADDDGTTIVIAVVAGCLLLCCQVAFGCWCYRRGKVQETRSGTSFANPAYTTAAPGLGATYEEEATLTAEPTYSEATFRDSVEPAAYLEPTQLATGPESASTSAGTSQPGETDEEDAGYLAVQGSIIYDEATGANPLDDAATLASPRLSSVLLDNDSDDESEL